MNGTDLFIKHPVFALVISLLLLLLGGMGFSLLPIRETPDVQNPVVTVTTVWPGADPTIVETDLTEVLERQLNGIEGVRTLSSSSSDGSSTITVEFELSRNLEDAANDVRARVARTRKNLPDDIDEPTVEKADASAQPVMFLRLAATDADLLNITEVADTLVRDRIENIEGVSGLDMYGAQVYAMRLDLNAPAMTARGVTVTDIQNALTAGNVDLPAGRLEGDATQLSLHLDGGLSSVEDFKHLVIRSDTNGRVYLGDIATVRLGAENERTAARADGVASITVAITPQAKANIVDVSDKIRARLPDINAALPAGMDLSVGYDRADAVRASIHDVEMTLLVAFALVVVVIFLFLRDFRSTLVPTIAIPVSILGTFLILWILGFTINVFTLFGLVLAIGLVVDDAIVVLENVVRRMEEGEEPFEAAIQGARQIAFAVIATTLSLVAVFLPVVFTGGSTGRLFLEFGTTVAASVALSMVVALTLTPMLCSRLLKAHKKSHAPTENRLFSRSLQATMRHPWLVLPVLLGAMGVVGWGFNGLPREFFPTEDRNMFVIRTQAQEGTSFEWMNARMQEVEQILMPLVPERRVMLSRVGVGPGGVAAAPNTGMIVFSLNPAADRDRSQQAILGALKGPLAQITAFRTIPIQFPTVGRGFSSPLQIVLQHSSFEELAKELPRFLAAMRQIPGLTSVNEDLRLDRPELWLQVDRNKAADLGVPIRDVARTLQVLTGGLDLSEFKRGIRQYKVIASLPRDERASPQDLNNLYLRAKNNSMVPLGSLLSSQEQAGATSHFHYNRLPSATISANLDGITVGEAIKRVQTMAVAELPPGFHTALTGESRDFAESSSSLAGMFLLALALVYLLLSAQFDSFIAPLSIMLSVPLALAGAFAALWLGGYTLSFFGQVGLILLVGLVTKNGILIVEYARHLQDTMGPWKAAEEAARLRFRPILMTSVATIGGAIPIALGLSGSSRASLGVAVVGGMLTATVLTLYVTPVVYAALASIGRKEAKVLLFLFIPLLGIHRAEAAEFPDTPLRLAQVLSWAAEHNLDVQVARTGPQISEAAADAVRAALLPNLSASVGTAYGNDSQIDGASGTAGLLLTAPLLNLSALSTARAARQGATAADATADATIDNVLTTVASRYISLQKAQQSVITAEERLQEATELERVATDKVAVGVAAPIVLTRAALAKKQAELALLYARNGEQAARLKLLQALGLPLDAALQVTSASPLLDPRNIPGEAALEEALQQAANRPDVQAAAAKADAATASRQAATAASLPTLSAYGKVAEVTDFSSIYPSGSVGATLSIPLYAGGSRLATVTSSRAAEEAAQLTLSSTHRLADAEVRLALRSLQDATAALGVADQALALAREELDRAEAAWKAGASDNLAVIAAQSSLANSALQREEALSAYNLAVIEWYRARGLLLTLAQ